MAPVQEALYSKQQPKNLTVKIGERGLRVGPPGRFCIPSRDLIGDSIYYVGYASPCILSCAASSPQPVTALILLHSPQLIQSQALSSTLCSQH